MSRMSTSTSFHRTLSRHCSIPKDHGSALKKFLLGMRSQNFDEIKLATYRAAAKLHYVQRSTNLHLVDIYNIIEAFRENGLNTLDHAAEIEEARLETIIQSIYSALFKRLPSTKDFDPESCIALLSQWIMNVYDTSGTGKVQVLSVKTALSTLCEGRLIDKFRYVFTQISENDGILNIEKLDKYLNKLLLLPCSIGEEPSFGYSSDTLETFLAPVGKLKRKDAKLDDFLDAFVNVKDKQSGLLYWLHMLNKLSKAENVTHHTQCKACARQGFSGLRYKCSQCYSYNICQNCFWRERPAAVNSPHKQEHTMKEYLTWGNKSGSGTPKKKLSCSPSKSSGKLPDYPKEPEPNKMLDMSNIVPALPPSEPCSPNTTLARSFRRMNGSVSQHSNLSQQFSTLSRGGSRGASRKYSQENLQQLDDEHLLISLYVQKLATEKLNENIQLKSNTTDSPALIDTEPNSEQKKMLLNLEANNRELLQQIKQLKVEHEEATKNAQNMGAGSSDPNLQNELKVLRERKDELEMKMQALQETRRELMAQLEGLMKLLKNNQLNSPRQTSHSSLTSADSTRKTSAAGPTASSMRGVNGDVKEAFGRITKKDTPVGQDLRADVMTAVNEVTSAMTSVVNEFTRDDSSPIRSSDEYSGQGVIASVPMLSNTEVLVH